MAYIIGIGAVIAAVSVPVLMLMKVLLPVKFPTVQMLQAEGMNEKDAIHACTYNNRNQNRYYRLYAIPVFTLMIGLGLVVSGVLQKTGLWNIFEFLSTIPQHPSVWTAVGLIMSAFSLSFMLLCLGSGWLYLTINGNREVKDMERAEQKVRLFEITMASSLSAAVLSLFLVFF